MKLLIIPQASISLLCSASADLLSDWAYSSRQQKWDSCGWMEELEG